MAYCALPVFFHPMPVVTLEVAIGILLLILLVSYLYSCFQLVFDSLYDGGADTVQFGGLEDAGSCREGDADSVFYTRFCCGRPSVTPFALALISPDFTRSRIIARSNSANTPSI
jgi:hypothetical protein